MPNLERHLRLLGEVAIHHYGADYGRTTDALSLAQDLIKSREQIEKYVDKVFMGEGRFLLFPIYNYGYMRVSGDAEGIGFREFLISTLQEDFYQAMLLSVDNKKLERFVYVCMNVGEVLKEEYLYRVERLNKEKELILNAFERLNK